MIGCSHLKSENFKMKETNFKITPIQQMISSCTGALMSSVFVTPLDVIKIRLQAQQKHFAEDKCLRVHFSKRANMVTPLDVVKVRLQAQQKQSVRKCFLYCNGFVDDLCCTVHANENVNLTSSYWYRESAGKFSGTVDTFSKIARTEGISALWSGLPPTLVMAVPATVVYFTVYDQLRMKLLSMYSSSCSQFWIPAFSGGAARAIAATLISPLELVRTKRQSKKLSYPELCNALKHLVRSQGVHSLWRGLGPTLLRDVPFSSLYWANYELLKRKFQQQTPSFWFSFIAGATSGMIAAVLTLPFDVIKTHRQIELGDLNLLSTSSRKQSTYFLLKKLYQKNGYTALFAGGVPRVVKIAPACAIMISTYEYGKHFFHNYNASKSIVNSA